MLTIDGLKQQLQDYAERDFEGLRAASEYQTDRVSAQIISWMFAALGIFALLNAYSRNPAHPWLYELLVVSVLQMVFAVIGILAPRRWGVLIAAVQFALLAVWMFIFPFLLQLPALLLFSAPLGLLYLVFLRGRLRRFRKIVSSSKPNPEADALLQQARQTITAPDATDHPDVIEFKAGPLWRVLLMPDLIAMTSAERKFVWIARGDEFAIHLQGGRTWNSELSKVRLLMEKRWVTVVMPKTNIQRYEAWAAARTPSAES